MTCPKCHSEQCEEVAEEVDIGVGVQKFVIGAECQRCGPLTVCNGCGRWDFQRVTEGHASWCPTIRPMFEDGSDIPEMS